MSKLAIVTRADDNVRSYTDITHKTLRKYAEFCGADFKVISSPAPFLTADNNPHYRILEVYNMFDTYDRILHLDSDMLVNKDCPNLFEIVPENCIGSIYEDVGSRMADRRHKLLFMQSKWGDVGWRTGYTNAGTFMMSKCHRNIFLPHNEQYWIAWGSADLHMSYNIHKFGFDFHELDFTWNHMAMFSEPWNNHPDRFKSKIIHYAGKGIFDEGVTSRIEQIKLDYQKIYGDE